MFDFPSLRRDGNSLPHTLLVAVGLVLAVSSHALTQETAPEPAPSGDEPAADSAAATEQEAEEPEDVEESAPPPPPPPDGILPVGELARFEYSPRDRPHVLLVGDYLIISTRGGLVHGIDAISGEPVWKLGLPGEELLPAVVLPDLEEISILLSTPSGRLFFVDGETGRIESEERLGFSLALEPLVSEAGILYAGTPEGMVHGYDLASNTELFATETGEVPNALAVSHSLLAVSGAVQTLTGLDPLTGAVKWTHRGRGPFLARASFDRNGERLYVGSDTGEFYCLDAPTGDVKFSWPTGASIRSPALVEGHRVYVASYGNTLYAYGASNGHEQWRANLPGRPASAPVRIYQRFMVVTQDGTLVEIVPVRGQLAKSHTLSGEISLPPAFHVVPAPVISELEEQAPATAELPVEQALPTEELPAEAAPSAGELPVEEGSPTGELPAEEELSEPEEPKWYELSRIAISLKSGQVVLLAHQPPEPTEPEETEGEEGEEGAGDAVPETAGEGSAVPF